MNYTLKLTISSLQNYQLLQYLTKIKNILNNEKIIIIGNILKKKKNTIYTVLRSPHVNKKSREQFNLHKYFQIFYIKTDNFYILINFFIFLKKILPKNIELKAKILKN